jgi:hypothetical protein
MAQLNTPTIYPVYRHAKEIFSPTHLRLTFHLYIFLIFSFYPLFNILFFMIFFSTFYFLRCFCYFLQTRALYKVFWYQQNIFWTQITNRDTFISIPVSIKICFLGTNTNRNTFYKYSGINKIYKSVHF